jgi:hypothetical protein
MKIKKVEELSRELIDRTSDAMISRNQHRRANRLLHSYFDANYDFKPFVGKSIFRDEFVINIKMDEENIKDTKLEVIKIYISNNTEFNTSHHTMIYYINEDKWEGFPHKSNISRQDVRLLGKIAAVVNPETKYKTGTADVEIGEY